MSDVSVKLNWDGGLKFTCVNAGGHQLVIDGDKEVAASPVEILLESLGACSAIDVVIIMEKGRTPLQKLEISLEGNRHSPEPRYFTEATVRFDAWGEGIKSEKLERAIALSFEKYCSVYHSLRPDMKLRAEYRIHPVGADPAGDYVKVPKYE